jgi:hypothetical protein
MLARRMTFDGEMCSRLANVGIWPLTNRRPRVVGPASVLGRTLTYSIVWSYVVPTLGQPYQPNGWVAHVGLTWGERWHANCDVRPTMPTMYQRWINVLLLTEIILDMFRKVSMFLYINVLINRNDAKRSNFNELITLSYYFDNSILPYSGLFSRV